MRRWSLRARFLLVLISLMVLVFASFILLVVRENTSTLRNNLITNSKSFAALATEPIGSAFNTYNQSGTIKIDQEISNFTSLDPDIDQVTIDDTSGNALFSNSSNNPISISPEQATSIEPSYIQTKNGNLSAIVEPYLESYGIHRYNVVYGISYGRVNQSIDSIIRLIVALSAVILVVSLVAWYILINRLFLRPIAFISHIALAISRGSLDQKVHLGRNDEIGDLAQAVDTMASSLKADIQKLKDMDQIKSEFLMIISHNLRTPLTIIGGLVDNLKSMDNPEKLLPSALKDIASSVSRLNHFSEDALTISTMEVGSPHVSKAPVDVSEVIAELAEEFAAQVKQKNIHFTSHLEKAVWVSINRTNFRSALWNILDNALKFTNDGGSIELRSERDDKNIKISVKDSGIGISESEIPKLFTKFHRGTDIMHYSYEGAGIGLYLCKLIVEQHNGTIGVVSKQAEGSTFTISLPVVPAPIAVHKNSK